ncbi:hypothetical protein B0A52_02571 [Exophiala mesophila]|uniref:Roadblock/LAMTOR2 domain-containing protein n=1 Tax=Exophiala mesophila TaxID=212818 RepID=A0A438ND96_EXOME|nr:hypothetical protein B0A52_02571 [Exophiala mesophila]
MSQACLLDSSRLSSLLEEALEWSDHVSSLMVSSLNGSILAYAYRNSTPSIKAMRTQSTTMTAAFTVASEDVLVFEAQNMGATSVITPIADHILLAVTGPEPHAWSSKIRINGETAQDENGNQEEGAHTLNRGQNGFADSDDEEQQQIRTDLELVGQELANMLREELSALKWPNDI